MNATEAIEIVRGVRTVRLKKPDGAEENLEVKELSWPDAIALLGALGEVLPTIVALRSSGSLTTEAIKETVLKTGSLADALLEKAAGLDAEKRRELGYGAGLAILGVALDVNLSEAVVGNVKTLGTVVRRLVPSDSPEKPAAAS